MAAAYAARLSLMHTIEQLQHHPRPPVSLYKKQVQCLTENVAFMQAFLERYSHGDYSEEVDGLESRIADAAYAAEDVIESHIVDQIHNGSISQGKMEEITSPDLYHGLQKVIEDMDSIKKDVMEIEKELRVQDQRCRVSVPVGSVRLPSTSQSTMVGLDDVLYEAMDKLIGGRPARQIIPIVGMGGIGKTTLARNIFENQVVVQHFDVRAWVTISQEFNIREIFSVLLKILEKDEKDLSQMHEYELRDKLHKKLSGRRYLIIMDDLWNIEVWDQLRLCFPDNKNGSRIMMTTRLSNLAFELTDSHGIELGLLDEHNSWDLLCKTVFGKEDCPPELEEIGMEIASRCKGLPLLITVVGGQLVKSEKTREYWEYIAKNVSTTVSLNDESCLKILHMSYKELPIHLKPCFLYMGVFREDYSIRVFELIELWVCEGFIKQIGYKSMEMVAEEYLTDLIERNLILVEKGLTGKIKFCSIHDVLRELCLKEAQKHKFLCVKRPNSLDIPPDIESKRRIGIYQSRLEKKSLSKALHEALGSMSLVRTLICYPRVSLQSHDLRLLRVLKRNDNNYKMHRLEDIGGHYVNSRFLALGNCDEHILQGFRLFWNLQVIKCSNTFIEIWNMPQLRHVEIKGFLPDPHERDDVILKNLQTLSCSIIRCGEKVPQKIPNVKKLKLRCVATIYYWSELCLNNLGFLHKLENLRLSFKVSTLGFAIMGNVERSITFPHSLKKLTLDGNISLYWEDVTKLTGSLPLLQVLKLNNVCIGDKWETVEGQFLYWNTGGQTAPTFHNSSTFIFSIYSS